MVDDGLNLLTADRKNIFRGALSIFGLGAVLFYLNIKLYLAADKSSQLLFLLAIPCMYIISGLFGIFSAYGTSYIRLKAYRMSLYILIFFNIVSICFGVFCIVVLMHNNKPCDHKTNDTCALSDGIYMLLIITIALSIIISLSLIGLFVIFLKQLRAFNQDLILQELEL